MSTPTKPSHVNVQSVALRLSNTVVLDDVSLALAPGEIFVLLGPSGCGKTTLLRSIAGLNRPDAGHIDIAGLTCFDSNTGEFVQPEKRSAGMVFQRGALFPHLNVKDNVAFGLGKNVDPDRVSELLEIVGMTQYAMRFPKSLSGGQAQRVALARALAPKPKVLLLDEPFSALDSQLRLSLRTEVLAILKETGVTAILVTHDQDEAFYMGDRIAVMHNGNIEQVATPRELYEAPASAWISEFVGEANLVAGITDGAKVQTALGELVPGPTLKSETGKATVVIRPEHLSVTAGGPYRVEDKAFFGHDILLTVAHESTGEILHIRRQTDFAEVNSSVNVEYTGGPVHGWAI